MTKLKGVNAAPIDLPTTSVPVDHNPIPGFLVRPRLMLPMTEDMNTEPVLDMTPLSQRADNIPLKNPPNPTGMNMLELYLTEGGRRRYLVVSFDAFNMQLLHIPDLENVEIDIRTVNEQVALGKAHWFSLPPRLDERLINKAVAWEMYKFRYSRPLVNLALTNLGRPPLDEPQSVKTAIDTGMITERKRGGGGGGAVNRGPGVISTLIDILKSGGGTIDEMYAKLVEAFPDREKLKPGGMKATIKTQLGRLPKEGKLVIQHEDGKFWADGTEPTPPPLKTEGGVFGLVKKLTGAFDPNVEAIANMPKSDFVEQVAKQKAREKEYIAHPPVGELASRPTQNVKRHGPSTKSKAKKKKKS